MKIMRKHFVILIGILCLTAAMLMAGCTKKPQSVRLVMGYIPNVQFAPWYVAQEKGFFKEAGLDITMDYGQVNDLMRLLAAGEVDFAIAGGDEIIVARDQGLPVVYVMSLYARFPAAVIALQGTGIQTPGDLKGKEIGLPGFFGTNYIAIKAILANAGLTEKDVMLRPIGYAQVPALTEGKVQAVVGFANNEPVQLKRLGYEINVIHSFDYFDLVGHGVIAGEKKVQEQPDQIKAFVHATLEGMRFALGHPEEAFEICLKYAPEAGGANREVQFEVLRASMKLWESAVTRENGLGYSDPEAWTRSYERMKEWGIVRNDVQGAIWVNNRFLGR